MTATSIALNRFGLGARAGEAPPADAKRWLLAQLDRYDPRPQPLAAAPTGAAVATRIAEFHDTERGLRQQFGPRRQPPGANPPAATMPPPAPAEATAGPAMAAEAPNPYREARRLAGLDMRADYAASVAARFGAALLTDAPFVERLVHFWSNHFAVSIDKLETIGLAGPFEFEAIRPHVLGRFCDMLGAVERHPAMLVYLDQAVSIGPDSLVGQRIAGRGRRRAGLNENLAREIMELHTLGVRSGYTQADVTAFARAMTGWTAGGIGGGDARVPADVAPGTFAFVPAIHEPGDREVMGRRYPAGGEAQAQAVLANLAASPATATHLATKLARHFAGDTPPPAMVERLRVAWMRSGGDLPTVYRAIVASPECWTDAPPKFRTPWDWAVACHRALGTRQVQPGAVVGLLDQLGQPTWKPGQPVGYDDVAASWAGPDALMRRVEAAERFAGRAPESDARALASQLFPGSVSPGTAQAIARAESPAQGLALLLASPEMMRR